jgi:hypothetical protein
LNAIESQRNTGLIKIGRNGSTQLDLSLAMTD